MFQCFTILSTIFLDLPALRPGRRCLGFIKIIAAAAQLGHSVCRSNNGAVMNQHAAMSSILRGDDGATRFNVPS